MAFAFIGNNHAATAGATSLDCNRPAGIGVGNLVIAVYAFPGVAMGSGPWIVPNIGQLTSDFIGPAEDWLQVCWSAPSSTGVGIEVWAAIHESGTHQNAQFATSQGCVTVCAGYSGEYNPSGAITPATVRLAPTAQVTGNRPAAPSVSANGGELIVACGADLMGGAAFGAPSGFTNRIDTAIGGAGTGEATIADATVPTAGVTGPITFPNNAATAATLGTTATLAIVPAPTTAGPGAVLDAPMPEDLDLPDGYVLTWAAIDPTTGADVAGVLVSGVSLYGEALGDGTGGGGELVGPFMLVPGPGA
jgi:hypothetical protein